MPQLNISLDDELYKRLIMLTKKKQISATELGRYALKTLCPDVQMVEVKLSDGKNTARMVTEARISEIDCGDGHFWFGNFNLDMDKVKKGGLGNKILSCVCVITLQENGRFGNAVIGGISTRSDGVKAKFVGTSCLE